MRERVLSVAGLIVFVGVCTAPAWYARATGTRAQVPTLQRPAQARTCILPAAEMRERHMALLVSWRDTVVRTNVRTYTAPDGGIRDQPLEDLSRLSHEQGRVLRPLPHLFRRVPLLLGLPR